MPKMAEIKSIRKSGRVDGIPGIDWLEPGQSIWIDYEVALGIADEESTKIVDVTEDKPDPAMKAKPGRKPKKKLSFPNDDPKE